MDTLKCIHNILTAGIFVLFCLICFLVNKCCCCSSCEKLFGSLNTEITEYLEEECKICCAEVPCQPEPEPKPSINVRDNYVNVRVKDKNPSVPDKIFTLRNKPADTNHPESYIDVQIKSGGLNYKDQIINIKNTPIDSSVISPDITPDPDVTTNKYITSPHVTVRVRSLDSDVPDKVYTLRRSSFYATDNEMNIRVRNPDPDMPDQLITFRPNSLNLSTPGRLTTMENKSPVPEIIVSLKNYPNDANHPELILVPGAEVVPEIPEIPPTPPYRFTSNVGTICPEVAYSIRPDILSPESIYWKRNKSSSHIIDSFSKVPSPSKDHSCQNVPKDLSCQNVCKVPSQSFSKVTSHKKSSKVTSQNVSKDASSQNVPKDLSCQNLFKVPSQSFCKVPSCKKSSRVPSQNVSKDHSCQNVPKDHSCQNFFKVISQSFSKGPSRKKSSRVPSQNVSKVPSLHSYSKDSSRQNFSEIPSPQNFSKGPSCQKIDTQKILEMPIDELLPLIKPCDPCPFHDQTDIRKTLQEPISNRKNSSDESDEIIEHTVRVKVRVLESTSKDKLQSCHEHITPSGTKISIKGAVCTDEPRIKKVLIGSPFIEDDSKQICPRSTDQKTIIVQVPVPVTAPKCMHACDYEEDIPQFSYTVVPCKERRTPCSSKRLYEEHARGEIQYDEKPSRIMKDACVGICPKSFRSTSARSHRKYTDEEEEHYVPRHKKSTSYTTATTDSSRSNNSDKVNPNFNRPYHSDIIRKKNERTESYDELDSPKLNKETRRMYDEIRTDIVKKNRMQKSPIDMSESSAYSDQLDDTVPVKDPEEYQSFKKNKITAEDNYVPYKKGKYGPQMKNDKAYVPHKHLSSPCKRICSRDYTGVFLEESESENSKKKYTAPCKRKYVCRSPGSAQDEDNDSNLERKVSDGEALSADGNVTEFPPVAEDTPSKRFKEKNRGGPVRARTPDSRAQNAGRGSPRQRNQTNYDSSRREIKTPPSTCGSPCNSLNEVERLYKKYTNNVSQNSTPSSTESDECGCENVLKLLFEKYGTPLAPNRARGRGRARNCQKVSPPNNVQTRSIGTKKNSEKKNTQTDPQTLTSTSSTDKQYTDMQQYSDESITSNERNDIGIRNFNSPKDGHSNKSSTKSWKIEIGNCPDTKSTTAVDIIISNSRTKVPHASCASVCPNKRPYSYEGKLAYEEGSPVFDDECDAVPIKKRKTDETPKEYSSTVLSNKSVAFNDDVQKLDSDNLKYILSKEFVPSNGKNDECKSTCDICKIISQIEQETHSDADVGDALRSSEDEILRCSICAKKLDIEKDKFDCYLRCSACIKEIRAEMNKTDNEKLSNSDIFNDVLKPVEISTRRKNYKIDPKRRSNGMSSLKPLVRIRPRSCGPCACTDYRTKKVSSKITVMSKCNTSIEDLSQSEYFTKSNNPLLRITINLEELPVKTKIEGPANKPNNPDRSGSKKSPDDKCNCTDIKPGEPILDYLNRMRRNNIIPYPACCESWSHTNSAPSSSITRTEEKLNPMVEVDESYSTLTDEKLPPMIKESDYTNYTTSYTTSTPKQLSSMVDPDYTNSAPSTSSTARTLELLPMLEEENDNLTKKVSLGQENRSNVAQGFSRFNSRCQRIKAMKYFSEGPSTSGVANYGNFYPYRNHPKRPVTQPSTQQDQPSCMSSPSPCKNYYTNIKTLPDYGMLGTYHSVPADQPQMKSIYAREKDKYSPNHPDNSILSPCKLCGSISSAPKGCHPNYYEKRRQSNGPNSRVQYKI